MPRTLYEPYREQLQAAAFPFADGMPLSNAQGDMLPAELFFDAAIYAPAGGPRFYLSSVTVDFSEVTLWIGSEQQPQVASVKFNPNDPPESLALTDSFGRSAGILVSDVDRLKLFQSWSLGTHTFSIDQAAFAAAACWPLPTNSVQGLLLDDGTLVTNDLWLAGADGVVLEIVEKPDLDNPGQTLDVIRVNFVGDPLFRRRLCAAVFESQRYLRTVTFQQGCWRVVAAPNSFGHVMLTAVGQDTPATILRIRPTADGLFFGVVGERLEI